MEINTGKKLLYTSTMFIVGIYFLLLSLVEAQGFLAPLVMSIVLALLMIPLSNKLENLGLGRGWSSLMCTILLFIISIGVFVLLSFQVKNFVDDWEEIKEQMKPKIEQAEEYLYEHTALNKEDFEAYKEQNDATTIGGEGISGAWACSFMIGVMSFLSNYLLVFMYILFLLTYRKRFKIFILQLAPDTQKGEAREVIDNTATLVQQYLVRK